MENIRITNNSSRTATIDIEGIIGMAENLQFDQPETRVATYGKLRETLDRIRGLHTPRVIVNIRSAGGDVNDALLIHDSLRSLDARITTRCYGYIASAATIIAQAASSGKREISANSLYLVHNSVSRAEGNTRALNQTMELLRKTDERIAAIYAARSGKPADGFLALMDENEGNGRWLSPEETIEMGLADRITGAAPITNAATEQLLALRLPEPPEVRNVKRERKTGIARKLLSLLALMGIGERKDAETSQPLFEVADGQDMQVAEADVQNSASQTGKEVAELKNKVAGLEAQDAKLRAKATQTDKKEDPSASDAIPSANRSAYDEDALNFK